MKFYKEDQVVESKQVKNYIKSSYYIRDLSN